METLSHKIEVIQNYYYRYHEEILESFSEIIAVKLGKNYMKDARMVPKVKHNMVQKFFIFYINTKIYLQSFYIQLYTIRKTNFSAKKCVSGKPIHELRTAFYTLFVYSSIVQTKIVSTNIPFEFHQTTASLAKQR